jgi:argininosuccinate synthase
VAHGCTGKGNDQVRFDVSVTALAPELEIIAPVREWPMSREEEIDYAAKNDIPIPIGKDNPFSIDQNLWGRSIECGVLEDPWVEPPEEAFEWTVSPEKAPNTPTYIEITFEKGIPIALDGKQMPPVELVKTLNKIAGQNGFGRIDHVENRLVGIKSRENYECPASLLLIKAHQDLEHLTLTKDVLHFKYCIEQKYAELIYDGLWFSPLKDALDAFIDKTQEVVNGTVRVKLFKGNAKVVGRKSPNSLYDLNLATYAEDVKDMFDHNSAKGFITLWGLPTKVNAIVNSAKASK